MVTTQFTVVMVMTILKVEMVMTQFMEKEEMILFTVMKALTLFMEEMEMTRFMQEVMAALKPNTNEQLIDAGSGDDRMYIRSGSKNVKILAGDGDDHIDGDFRYLDAGSGDDDRLGYNYGYKVDYFDGGTGTDELLIINVHCPWSR